MRHLTILVLSGALGTLMLSGSAEACHKRKCGGAAPAACAPAPVVYAQPVACAQPARTCAPRAKKCGGGGLCHKRNRGCGAPATCATPVSYAYGAPMVAPSGQSMATPQASYQH